MVEHIALGISFDDPLELFDGDLEGYTDIADLFWSVRVVDIEEVVQRDG